MYVVKRQMTPDVTKVAEVAQQFADDRLCLSAERALQVAVLHERHERLHRSADVVAVEVDRVGEIDDHVRRAEKRAQAQPSRQPRGHAEEQPAEQRRHKRCREDAELRLFEFTSVERERRDEERDGEPDAGEGAAAEYRNPARPAGGTGRA